MKINCKDANCPEAKNICCAVCESIKTCKGACDYDPSICEDSIIDEENGLILFEQKQIAVLQEIADIVTAKKKLEETEKQLKDKLQISMSNLGIKKFTSDVLNITYVAATTATSVDSKKLKEKYPDIHSECSKVSSKSAYVKVEVK